MDLAGYRNQFPVLSQFTYLNHASETPVSTPVRRRVDEYLDAAFFDPDSTPFSFGLMKELLAQVMGGSADEYALMPNTSTGLGITAGGLSWQPGDNVVIPDEEYPANTYPWLNLRDRGVQVRIVPLDAHLRVSPEAVAERVDARTRVVAVSAVEYLSGFRNDLSALSRIAHDRGALFVVDAIQAAGAVPVNVEAHGIDVLCGGGYKWLMGPVGTGFAYFRRSVWDQLRPVIPGSFGSVKGPEDAHGEFALLPSAQRFESGCLAFSLFHGWTAALELMLEVGLPAIHSQVLELTDQVISGLQRLGHRVVSPVATASERSGIVTFTTGSSESDAALVRRVRERGVVIAFRGGRCRVSPHFYNDAGDVNRLLEAVR